MFKSRAFRRFARVRVCVGLLLGVMMITEAAAQARPGMAGANRPPTQGGQGLLAADESAAPMLKEPRVLFGRPARRTPAEQLAHARALEAAGRFRRARRAYNALVHKWGHAPEAVDAQLGVAALHELSGNFKQAFREYQYYVDHFADGGGEGVAYDDVLAAQFAVANAMRARMGAGWFSAPGGELVGSMFGRIAANAPDWARAAESMMLQATCYELEKKYLDAIPVYEALAVRYPRSPFRVDALYRAAHCRHQMAQRYPRDERTLRNALAALIKAKREDPAHALAAETSAHIIELSRRLTAANFEKAEFYERIRRNPQAAIVAYREFLAAFPTAAEADEARARIRRLEAEVADPGRKPGAASVDAEGEA